MKHTQTTLAAVAGLFLLGGSWLDAGEYEQVDPVQWDTSLISGAVAVGYDTTYIFRGANLGQDAPWAEAAFMMPVGGYTVSAGAWYINPTSPAGGRRTNQNDELDLFVNASTTLSFVNIWFGYTAYLQPELGRGSTNEIGVGWKAAINFFDIGFSYFYDFDLRQNYFEYMLGKNINLNDSTYVNVGMTLGHVEASNFHGVIKGQLNFELSDSATISPYVAYNFVDADRPVVGDDGRFFGGVSLTVSF